MSLLNVGLDAVLSLGSRLKSYSQKYLFMSLMAFFVASNALADVNKGSSLQNKEGMASYYGPNFHGKCCTASGETVNMYDLTAAHRTLPFGTRVKVTNLKNQRTVIVRINDRGPFHGGRIIDLSTGAFQKIATKNQGVIKVRLAILNSNSDSDSLLLGQMPGMSLPPVQTDESPIE